MTIILKQFVLGPLEDNNFLLIDEDSKEAVLIDCTSKCQEIDDTLEEYGAKLKYILLTHGHFDHVLGVNDFKKKHNDCQILIHKNDQTLLDTIKDFARNFTYEELEVQKIDGYVEENQVIKFGNNEIKVIHTPGHTQGGVSYLLNDKVFTGDTLFYNSVGRTDLPGGSFHQLKQSIEEKLFTLNPNTTVYPGHGSNSTIEYEKNNNKFL